MDDIEISINKEVVYQLIIAVLLGVILLIILVVSSIGADQADVINELNKTIDMQKELIIEMGGGK